MSSKNNLISESPYKDPEKQKEFQRNWVAARRKEYFKDKECAVCGAKENLELDHINPEEKVSHNIWSWSTDKRDAELKKCQVLCKTHHEIKSSGDRSDWREGKWHRESYSEIDAIRENLFGDNFAYIILYETNGNDEGTARIADIERRGPQAVMESLLQSPFLKITKKLDEKPWSFFDRVYHLGDYSLIWSYKENFVRLVETVDESDPYSNESVEPQV